MGTVDTFDEYVESRLEEWGTFFALHRDYEQLGHRSKDMLQVLIEHKGEMPPRTTGFKPLEVPPLVQMVEDAVHAIARRNPSRAAVLRAFYCGTGRRGHERLEIANTLLRRQRLHTVSRASYYREKDAGFDEVKGYLLSKSRGN